MNTVKLYMVPFYVIYITYNAMWLCLNACSVKTTTPSTNTMIDMNNRFGTHNNSFNSQAAWVQYAFNCSNNDYQGSLKITTQTMDTTTTHHHQNKNPFRNRKEHVNNLAHLFASLQEGDLMPHVLVLWQRENRDAILSVKHGMVSAKFTMWGSFRKMYSDQQRPAL